MKKLFSWGASACLVVVAVAACQGDDPKPQPGPGGREGEQDGPCFTNNTCNAGLSCGIVGDIARCVADAGAGSSTSSSSSSTSSSSSGSTTSSSSGSPDGGNDGGDSGSSVCNVTPSKFPCPAATCYGQAESCSITGCNTGEARWECHAPKDCGGGAGDYACCVPSTAATAKPAAACGVGTLAFAPDQESGASCKTGSTCDDGAAQLCASASDCPSGQRCVPIKPTGSTATVNALSLGLCVK